MDDSADFKDMTRKIDNYMEGNKQGVSCLTPIGTVSSADGSTWFRIDKGIIAYGWNDQPFNFAGSWTGGCKGNNIRIS
ncbi:hypothetical protein WAI453_003773 [Rhynchosporium graminicola]